MRSTFDSILASISTLASRLLSHPLLSRLSHSLSCSFSHPMFDGILRHFSTPLNFGLEQTASQIKAARVITSGKKITTIALSSLDPQTDDVKQLYMNQAVLITPLDGKELLVRPLRLPLIKEKDIAEAVPFQAEPLLPYPLEESVLTWQIVAKSAEATDVTFFAARKQAVATHVEKWKELAIEPEKIFSVPYALCTFGAAFFPSLDTFILLHITNQEVTSVLVRGGKLWASFAAPEGWQLLLGENQTVDSLPQNESEWEERMVESPLADGFKRLQRSITRLILALGKECKAGSIEGIAITGEPASWSGFSEILARSLNMPPLFCTPSFSCSSQELMSYAVPIGLSLGAVAQQEQNSDFRQGEHTYPHPWKRLYVPMALYFISVFFLSFAFYFFSSQMLRSRENELKQSYLDLLAEMHKSHEDFEKTYLAKNPDMAFKEELTSIKQISIDGLMTRLELIQKQLQASPDTFPLFPGIPRVSDVIAWLGTHSAVTFLDEEGKKQAKLQIENFSYVMVKRPEQGKKQEKYQVKVELEFTSATPKWAREFHDALIAPNDWVDPKNEVKWNANRDTYKTSFFLKDKTTYPGS